MRGEFHAEEIIAEACLHFMVSSLKKLDSDALSTMDSREVLGRARVESAQDYLKFA